MGDKKLLLGLVLAILISLLAINVNSYAEINKELQEKLEQVPGDEPIRLLVLLKPGEKNIQKELAEINSRYEPLKEELRANLKAISSKYSSKTKEREDEDEKLAKKLLEFITSKKTAFSEEDLKALERGGLRLEAWEEKRTEEVLSMLTENNAEIQNRFIQFIESKDGEIKHTFNVLNLVAIEVPASLVYEIIKQQDVISLELDIARFEPKLDDSVLTISAGTWWTAGIKGSGVADVAIVDTGVDFMHPDLEDDSEGFLRTTISEDFTESGTTDDTQGHGTHCAGIVASSHSSYRGVAPGVDKLISAKHLGGPEIYASTSIAALDWTLNNPIDNAEVLSNSWGCSYRPISKYGNCLGTYNDNCKPDGETRHTTLYLDAAVDYFDIVSVNAASNDGDCGAVSLGVPADAYNVITVGNINDQGDTFRGNDVIAHSSSIGPTFDNRKKPDIVAPGSKIKSTNYDWEGICIPDITGCNFVDKSGTSMAAPHVSGAAALLKQFGISSKGVKALLINTAEDKGTEDWDAYYGWGEVDLNRAYTHRDNVIDDIIYEDTYKLYKVPQIVIGERATLVWNRHVVYAGPTKPTTWYPLNELDLVLYKESNGAEIDETYEMLLENNVKQIKSPSQFLDGVVKVDAEDFFSHGANNESYSLSAERDYILAVGPVLDITQNVPATSADDFIITAIVENTGDLNAHDVWATLSLPAGLTIVTGSNPQYLGTVYDSAISNIAGWTVRAASTGTYNDICTSFDSNSYGENYNGNVSSCDSITISDIECNTNADCGTDGFVGSASCNSGDVYQDYRTYTCSNNGTPSSSCSFVENYQLKQSCAGGCSGGICITNATTGGYLWNAEFNTDKIYKLTTNGTIVANFSSPGTFPLGLTWDGTYLWNADFSDGQIYKLTTDGIVIANFSSPGIAPFGLAWDGTNLWNADYTNDKIYKLTTDGTVVDSFSTPGPFPGGLTFDGNYLWLTDWYTNQTYKLTTDGTVIDSFASPPGNRYGLTWDGQYLWEAGWSFIYKLTTDGGVIDSFGNPGPGSSDLAWQPASEIVCSADSDCGADGWVRSYCSGNDVYDDYRTYSCVNPATVDSYCTFSDTSQFKESCSETCTKGMCVIDVPGYLWATDAWTNQTYKLTTDGTVVDSFSSPGSDPTGLAWDGTYLWNADYDSRRIYKLQTDGTIVANFSSPGTQPRGLTFDGTYLWHADYSKKQIYKLTTDGTVVANFSIRDYDIRGLTFDGTYLWLADYNASGGSTIYKLTTDGTVVDSFAGPENNPYGLTFDGIYLWHSAWSAIYKLTTDGIIIANFSAPTPWSYSGLAWQPLASVISCDNSSYMSCGSAYDINNGETKTNMCGNEQFYKITLNNTCDLSWTMTPETDYDLYTTWDSSCPSSSNWACSPYSSGSTQEICTQNSSAPGTYYARVKLYSGSGNYSISADISNCGAIACYNNTGCGTDGYAGSPSCNLGDVWQDYRTWTCNNNGTASSYCSYSDNYQSKQTCTDGCSAGMCLIVEDSYLWHSDYGSDTIYKLTTNGTIVNSFASPGDTPFDLAWDGRYLWNIDRGDNRIYKLTIEGTIVDSFSSPGPRPHGLTFDGTYLWHSDWTNDFPGPNTIYKLQTNGTVVDNFTSPNYNPQGLTFDGNNLWHADASSAKIYNLTTTGTVTADFTSPGISPKGLAWDRTYLWNVDENDKQIYKLQTDGTIVANFSTPGNYPYGLVWISANETSCWSGLDCGINNWTGSTVCSGNDVWQNNRTYSCVNPATNSSYCTFSDNYQLKEACADTCSGGLCVGVSCYNNADCGTNDWTGSPSCNGDDIWQYYRTYTCSDPGEASASCSYSDNYQLKEACADTCNLGNCVEEGYLWNADDGSNMIYKLTTNGTVVANFSSTGTNPLGLTFDGSYLWNADDGSNMIYKLTTDGTVADSFSSPGINPMGLTFDGSYLWNSDASTDQIYKLTTNGTIIANFSAPGTYPFGLVWDGTYLWNNDGGTDTIYKLTTDGTIIANFSAPGNYSWGLTFDGTYLWVSHWDAPRIYKLTTNGTIVDSFVGPGTILRGLAWQAASEIACSSNSDCGVNDWTGSPSCSGNDVYQDYRTYTCTNPGTESSSCSYSDTYQPKETCADTCSGGSCVNATEGGYLWNADQCTNQIYKLTTNGAVVDSFASPSNGPGGLAFDGSYLWNVDWVGTIYKLTTDGTIVANFSRPGTWPNGLTFDGNNLWYADWSTLTIYKLATNGTIIDSFAGPGIAPAGLAWDGSYLWNADPGTFTIYKLQTDGSVVDSFFAPGPAGPFGLTWDGSYLWNADYGGMIYKLATNGTIVANFSSPAVCPTGLTWVSADNIACSADLDCGTDEWKGNSSCNGNDVWQTRRIYTCSDPGTNSSSCGKSDNYQLKQSCLSGCSDGSCIIGCNNNAECGTDGLVGSNYCTGDDVYQDYRTYICSNNGTASSSCGSSDSAQLKETCADTCNAGVCVDIACYNDAECGTDGFIGSNYCSSNDVYQDYRTYTCTNPATASSSCDSSDSAQLKTECGTDSCNGWGSNYCKAGDVYHSRTCYDKGCSGNSCYNNPSTEEVKVQECGTDICTGGNCIAVCVPAYSCGAWQPSLCPMVINGIFFNEQARTCTDVACGTGSYNEKRTC